MQLLKNGMCWRRNTKRGRRDEGALFGNERETIKHSVLLPQWQMLLAYGLDKDEIKKAHHRRPLRYIRMRFLITAPTYMPLAYSRILAWAIQSTP